MPPTPPARRITLTNAAIAAAGVALFAVLIYRVGPGEIWRGFRQIGWGLAIIVLLGGLRFAARALAWTLCIEPPNRLRFTDAFNAVVCGDTMGNVIPLGPLVSEAAKLACVRGRVAITPALTALAIENILYSLSVATMIAASTVALLLSFDIDEGLREFSEIALVAIAILFGLAVWILWRRPAIVGSLPAVLRPAESSRMHRRLERVRGIEHEVYSFAARRPGALIPAVAAEAAFHALGILEAHITLTMLGVQPTLLQSFIVEGSNRLLAVAFKFVPFQVGVGEVGTGLLTQILGLGTAPGVTLSLARKTRMFIWSFVGGFLLVRQGLTTRRLLDEAQRVPHVTPET